MAKTLPDNNIPKTLAEEVEGPDFDPMVQMEHMATQCPLFFAENPVVTGELFLPSSRATLGISFLPSTAKVGLLNQPLHCGISVEQ